MGRPPAARVWGAMPARCPRLHHRRAAARPAAHHARDGARERLLRAERCDAAPGPRSVVRCGAGARAVVRRGVARVLARAQPRAPAHAMTPPTPPALPTSPTLLTPRTA